MQEEMIIKRCKKWLWMPTWINKYRIYKKGLSQRRGVTNTGEEHAVQHCCIQTDIKVCWWYQIIWAGNRRFNREEIIQQLEHNELQRCLLIMRQVHKSLCAMLIKTHRRKRQPVPIHKEWQVLINLRKKIWNAAEKLLKTSVQCSSAPKKQEPPWGSWKERGRMEGSYVLWSHAASFGISSCYPRNRRFLQSNQQVCIIQQRISYPWLLDAKI